MLTTLFSTGGYNDNMTTYVLAGGCFWCLDAVYRRLKGVTHVVSGYAGGTVYHPTYSLVSTGTTGHAEVVQVTFNESIIPEDVVLDIFFLIHNPTTPDRQGNDIGPQYRSAMFYSDKAQKLAFEHAIDRAQKHWNDRIVTELKELDEFYPAEEYHQDYFNKNPVVGYCSIVIEPKIIKARSVYEEWFKEE